jgi:hypothetical protein
MLLGGLLPGTVRGIAARSGHGKTHELEKIQRAIIDYDSSVVILQCNWELELLKLLTRDIAVRTKKTAKEVMFKAPEGETLDVFRTVCEKFRGENMYFQEEPVSSEEFETDVMGLIDNNLNKRIVVTIDNLENILITDGSQKASMDKLLKTVNVLKKRHPFVAFIILNQANNELTKRADDPKRHKPMESDIYGTDQLFKLCDVVLFKVIPTKLGIYDKFMIFSENRYDWLEEFKVPSGASAMTFDPFGCVFRFFLKHRRVGEDNVEDLFIERMYTRASCGMTPLKSKSAPSFPKVVEVHIAPPLSMNPDSLNDSDAQGISFDETKKPF